MLGQEGVVQRRSRRRGLGLEHALGHGLQQRQVAADPDLQELVGELGAVADDPA